MSRKKIKWYKWGFSTYAHFCLQQKGSYIFGAEVATFRVSR